MVYDGYNVVVGLKQYNSFWVDCNFYRYVIYIFVVKLLLVQIY